MDEIVFASVPMGKAASREMEPVLTVLSPEPPSRDKFEDEHNEEREWARSIERCQSDADVV